nr:uncharacterized protein LOC128669328 isoform X1 [Plodia interpunctella]
MFKYSVLVVCAMTVCVYCGSSKATSREKRTPQSWWLQTQTQQQNNNINSQQQQGFPTTVEQQSADVVAYTVTLSNENQLADVLKSVFDSPAENSSNFQLIASSNERGFNSDGSVMPEKYNEMIAPQGTPPQPEQYRYNERQPNSNQFDERKDPPDSNNEGTAQDGGRPALPPPPPPPPQYSDYGRGPPPPPHHDYGRPPPPPHDYGRPPPHYSDYDRPLPPPPLHPPFDHRPSYDREDYRRPPPPHDPYYKGRQSDYYPPPPPYHGPPPPPPEWHHHPPPPDSHEHDYYGGRRPPPPPYYHHYGPSPHERSSYDNHQYDYYSYRRLRPSYDHRPPPYRQPPPYHHPPPPPDFLSQDYQQMHSQLSNRPTNYDNTNTSNPSQGENTDKSEDIDYKIDLRLNMNTDVQNSGTSRRVKQNGIPLINNADTSTVENSSLTFSPFLFQVMPVKPEDLR